MRDARIELAKAIRAIDDLHACIGVEFKDLEPENKEYILHIHERLHHAEGYREDPVYLGNKLDDAMRVASEMLEEP
jgi:hypothetical protein